MIAATRRNLLLQSTFRASFALRMLMCGFCQQSVLDCQSGNRNIRTTILVNEVVMNYRNIHSWSVNVDRRIALALRKDPKLLGVFERRLRSKMATTRSDAAVGDDDWEWYVILTLWSPLQVIKLLEDSSEQATRLRKTSPLLSLLSDPERRQLLSPNFLTE